MASPPRHSDAFGATRPHHAPAPAPPSQTSSTRPAVSQGPSIRTVDLAGLDDLGGEVLGLFCWSDVRPLKGVLGLVDWRLCGTISRAIEGGMFTGAIGDTLLLPLSARMGPSRLFIFGLGPKATWDNAVLRSGCQRAREVTRLAGSKALSLGAPACLGDVQIEQAFVKAASEVLGAQHEPLLVERLGGR